MEIVVCFAVMEVENVSRLKNNLYFLIPSIMKNENISTTGAVGSVLGIAVCPLCLPFSATLLSSLGIGVVIPFWPLIIGLFFLLAVIGFVRSFQVHKKIIPLILLILGGIVLYVGRYVVGMDSVWITGAVFIVSAVVANHRAGKNLSKECKNLKNAPR